MAPCLRSRLTLLAASGAAALAFFLGACSGDTTEANTPPTTEAVAPGPVLTDPPRTAEPVPSPSPWRMRAPIVETVTPVPMTTVAATVAETPAVEVQPPVPSSTPEPSDGVAVLTVGDRLFRIELAVTRQERSTGLSGRDHLDSDAGMLFVFSVEQLLTFWMKETLIPLDLIYIDSVGTVVNVHTMAPEPGVPDGSLTRYESAGPALYALEINAGLAWQLGVGPGAVIEVGDVVVVAIE